MKKFATVCLLGLFATTFLFSKVYKMPVDADYTVSSSNWREGSYVDKYGVKTGESYIYNYIDDGIFTNTATRGSECEANFIFDGYDTIRINAWEYGSYRVDSYESNGESYYFNVTAKGSKGYSTVISTGTATLTNYFYIQGSSTEPVLDALAQGKDITITLICAKDSVYKYMFNFKASGFANAYNRYLKDALEAEEEAKAKAFKESLEAFLFDEVIISGKKVLIKVGETTTIISCPDSNIRITEVTSLIDSIEPRYKAYFEHAIYKKLPSGDIGIYYRAIPKENRSEILTAIKKLFEL